jgi:hypothetical protein
MWDCFAELLALTDHSISPWLMSCTWLFFFFSVVQATLAACFPWRRYAWSRLAVLTFATDSSSLERGEKEVEEGAEERVGQKVCQERGVWPWLAELWASV